MSYKETNKNSPVSLVKHKSQIINVTGEMIANLCHGGVVTIGEIKLGIRRPETGTRSIRSGAAIDMYLAGVSVFLIMLIGRWSSTAFLKYIRKQIQEFLQCVSSKMIEVQSFKHVKNLIEMSPMENIVGYLFSLLMGKIGRGSIIAERTGVGSNQLSSKLYIGISRYLAHALFCFVTRKEKHRILCF